MSVEQVTLSNMKQMNDLILTHMQEIIGKMDHRLLNNDWIDLLTNFYQDHSKLSNNYQKSIFKLCGDLQKNLNIKFYDDKYAQYFQLLVNNILKHQNNLLIITKVFEAENFKLINKKDNFLNICEKNFVEAKQYHELLKNKMKNLDVTYSKYIKSNKKQERLYLGSELSRTKSKEQIEQELFDMNKLEQKTLNEYEELENSFNFNLENMNRQLKETSDLEMDLKKEVTKSMMIISDIVNPSDREVNKEKMENLERNLDNYQLYFKKLGKEMGLEFESSFKLQDMSSSFIDSYKFKKLEIVNSLNYIKFLKSKLSKYEKEISAKKKIFLEIVIENIYRSNSLLKKEDLKHLSTYFLEDVNIFFYFYYLLIYKKSQILLQKPFLNLTVPDIQMKNFVTLIENFFLGFSNLKTNENFEILYHMIKFSLSIINERKESIYLSLNKNKTLQNPQTWFGIYNFFFNTFGPDGLVFEEIFSHSNRVGKESSTFLSKVIKNIKTTPDAEINAHYVITFHEIINIILKCKLSFDRVRIIILHLISKIDLPFKSIRSILAKYEPDFYLSIKSLDNLQVIIYKKKLIKKKDLNREKKIYICLKNTVQYLSSNHDIINVFLISKSLSKYTNKIFKYILSTKTILNEDLRKLIYLKKINKELAVDKLEDIQEIESVAIIDLDVKRTLSYENRFGNEGLTKVLRNIAHPNIGNFDYYQGLNYFTNYFYHLFKGDTVQTYNFTITLMIKNFQKYFDKDLKGMKILFFNLKKLIKLYLPLLSNYYEEIKLDMDIIFASWCLTIFTTISHSFQKSFLLDQIIDLFVARGWPGFFKVVLVILEETQEKVLSNDFDQNLLFYSELCKNGFKFIIDKHTVGNNLEFNIKEKVKKYKYVNSCQSIYFKAEYDKVQSIYQEFWIEVGKTYKMKKKSKSIL